MAALAKPTLQVQVALVPLVPPESKGQPESVEFGGKSLRAFLLSPSLPQNICS